MTSNTQVLYTGKTHTTGGRDGAARSDDGRLAVALSSPGGPGTGTNPEQLLGAGWSACFIGALGLAARAAHVALPAGTAVDAEIDLTHGEGGYRLGARLRIHLPGLAPETARALVDQAHASCPYSKALSAGIPIALSLA
jgi:Ohr subfamily peroxiredoxin